MTTTQSAATTATDAVATDVDTSTQAADPGVLAAASVGAATPAAPINEDVRLRVNAAADEMKQIIKERDEVIDGIWVARIAQEHVLLLGPGGTGKSFLARNMASHIDGAKLFEVAVDETTDPSQIFGPPDIKAMVDSGRTRRIVDNMLPEATEAFIDEFFNANGPLLHSMMPALNERIFHNNGMPSAIPLRQGLMGTNKLNADADQAALWDRIHLRYVVQPITSREAQHDMIGEAIARMYQSGRGTVTTLVGATPTLVTVDELDEAHKEALALDVPESVLEVFSDLREELSLGTAQVKISDRRAVEGMAAVLANAWRRGHTTVSVADLDILTAMWWTTQDQAPAARKVILAATNPGDKAAMDLQEELDKMSKLVKDLLDDPNADDTRKKRLGIETIQSTDKLKGEATTWRDKALAAGGSTQRLDDLLARTEDLRKKVGKEFFGLNVQDMQNIVG